MSNELDKIRNKIKDDPELKELRDWARITKKMIPVIRRWHLNRQFKLDEGLGAFMSSIDSLLADADTFEKRTGKKADEEP